MLAIRLRVVANDLRTGAVRTFSLVGEALSSYVLEIDHIVVVAEQHQQADSEENEEGEPVIWPDWNTRVFDCVRMALPLITAGMTVRS